MMKSIKFCVLFMLALLFMLDAPKSTAGKPQKIAGKFNMPDTSLSEEVQRQLGGKGLSSKLHFPKTVARFYAAKSFQPAWISPQAGDSLAWQSAKMISCVWRYGLSHADYHPQELKYTRLHDILDAPGKVSIQFLARFEVLLTDAMLTLMNNLHFGKLNPDYPASRIDSDTLNKFRADQVLKWGLLQKDINKVIGSVQPKAKAYRDLQRQMQTMEEGYADNCYDTPPGEIRKIAVNMERLRWAETGDSVFIHINIPSYMLKLHFKDTAYAFKVIVGKPENPTPVLQSAVTYFTTAPEWKVPFKIFRKELLPKILKNPAFLENNHYAIYDSKGKYIEPITANFLNIKAHPEMYFLRQSAGCDNSLGLLVFRFPNIYDVYLHDTPEQKLFARSERHFSHGCVRVEQAEKLGRLLLINDGSQDKIYKLHNGMSKYIKQNIQLKQPVPIKITYLTCEVLDGKYITYQDIYNLDKSLEVALFGNDGGFDNR